MFHASKRSLRDTETGDLDTSVYQLDRKINKYQREVRRDVFPHLSISGVERLASGLVLVSIIIDLERIGDFTKNIVELAEAHQARLAAVDAETDLKRVETAVSRDFDRLKDILESGAEEAAEDLIRESLWVNPLCDERILRYVRCEDASVSRGDAVTLALYFRYLKRIQSHLRNVATSVSRPFHKIGFVPPRLLR
jgi:phosphate uptake regulator